MLAIHNLKETPQHLEMLAYWHHAQWSHFNTSENIQQRIERMKPYLNNTFIPSTYVATDHKLLGSAAIVANDMDTHPELTPWLASVYVCPEDRYHGTGSKLVTHIMHEALAHGIKTLFLFTPDKVSFYSKLGWEIINKELYHNQRVAVMKAALNNTC